MPKIDTSTKILGLIADPAKHSKSPLIHNLAFEYLNENGAFFAFEVSPDCLEDAIKGVRALNINGFSISMPHKIEIIPLLDEISEEARLIGAVNTVLNQDGKLIGYNTDGIGYMRSLKESNVDYVGKKLIVLGAGGAGTAIAMQGALEGLAEIVIFNRKDNFYDQAQRNAQIINEELDVNCKASVYDLADQERLEQEIRSCDILANVTSVGMKNLQGQTLLPEATWLNSKIVVTDAIYSPEKTKLLEQAESRGCKTLNGLEMLLWQGAKQFEIWTEKKLPVKYIQDRLFAPEVKVK